MPVASDVDQLRELHDAYAEAINWAVHEGQDDLIASLSDGYVDSALRVMTGQPPAAERATPAHPARIRHCRQALRSLLFWRD